MITFFLNGQQVSESSIQPDMTVLRYLRTRQTLTGTKEGCGSGDCGACSVLAGEMENGEWRYKAINSCITFLAQIVVLLLARLQILLSLPMTKPVACIFLDSFLFF